MSMLEGTVGVTMSKCTGVQENVEVIAGMGLLDFQKEKHM